MSATMTLPEFYKYTRENRKRMADIYREIEEIQYQFNDLHARQLEERRKLIAAYVPLLLEAPEDPPVEIAELAEAQEQIERKAIEEEITRLESETADKRREADNLVREAQRQVAYVRQQNPILDQQEEALKARRASMESEIQGLDTRLKQLRRFPIGWLTNFGKRRRLRGQRAQLAENLKDVLRGLRAVRKTWQADKEGLQKRQANLQSKWQALSVEAAQLQARLDYLTANVDELSTRRAVQDLLSNLEELPVTGGPWKDRLTPLLELNRSKTNYETGLTSVAEVLGLLTGLGEGMDRFIRSVATVYEEQRRYRLPSLTLNLSDAATSFHATWPDFQSKVKDEKYLGTHPLEFSQHVQGVVQERLHEPAIQKMFKDMGDALTRATKAWH